MNRFIRIASCTTAIAVLGLSGCILPPGHGRNDDERGSRRGSHHDDRYDRRDCDQRRENCHERERYAL